MESCDVIVVGAGLIGLSLARELQRRGMRVEIFEAGLAGQGASWAGAGMLAGYQTTHPVLRPLAIASARLYPTWIAELERETYLDAGYRRGGTLFLAGVGHAAPAEPLAGWERVAPGQLPELEPELRCSAEVEAWRIADDHSVDNRALVTALLASVRGRGITLREQARVEAIESSSTGMLVISDGVSHAATVVVNAAGAWAGAIAAPVETPVRPRKGQMICFKSDHGRTVRQVLAAPGIYLVPRAQGRTLAGATVEDVGFDPEVSGERVRELRQRAEALVPSLALAELENSWAGFRPCAPDDLPILGPTRCPGYWVATAHFRDGILLAPITAKIIAHAIATGHLTRAVDVTPFLPSRF